MMRKAERLSKLHGLLFLGCLLWLPSIALSHGTESHNDAPARVERPATVSAEPRGTDAQSSDEKPAHAESPAAAPATPDDARPSATISEKSQRSAATGGRADIGSFLSIETLVRDLSLAEFPTLHPLVVHVPVTFIPLAFVFALVGVFVVHRAVIGLALAFALGGLAGGWVAAFPTHPHTSRLSAAATATLQKHDFFAYGTLWLALAAVFVALVCLWKPTRLASICLGLVLLLASMSVAITGHYGGRLAYVHGIGVQGQHLSSH